MYGVLDISTSGLVAQRLRMEVASANIANKDVILNAEGAYEPYRRRLAVLAPGDPATGATEGVHIADILLDDAPPIMRFEPGSPFADKDGYVGYPNINTVTETINAMEAARSYEANIAAIEATKSMISVALDMIG